jgi:uncharacterized protein YbjT (DUF2867 family)
MKIAVTGATGFIGSALASDLAQVGHHVTLIARGSDGRQAKIRYLPNSRFFPIPVTNMLGLTKAFEGCTAVAHCAGINRESDQSFDNVHVRGTEAVIQAAHEAGVRRLAMISFLRARPACESPYHESKWKAEQLVRDSGLEYTVLKCGIIYGRGDHLLDHLSRSLFTQPFFATVGFGSHPLAPVAVEDVTRILRAVLVEGRLREKTVAVTGPERLEFVEVVRRVAAAVHRRAFIVPAPVWFHMVLAALCEWGMNTPLIARSQVKILADGAADPLPGTDDLPLGLRPARAFTEAQIRAGLPEPVGFGPGDLRWHHAPIGSGKK